MAKLHIPAIDYIRGAAMLGVIGIHTGGYAISNPYLNIHLFALLEILSRFSVPIFLFISGFGLFLKQTDLQAPFAYRDFLKRRLAAVLVPYLSWSFLYLLLITWTSRSFAVWSPLTLLKYLFFGLACYQLYFMLILLWFYLLMPLWRKWLQLIIQQPLFQLTLLLIVQIVFNYYSSYTSVFSSDNPLISMFLGYRLNYWVAHYFFIFLLGAVCALKFTAFQAFLAKRHNLLAIFFILTAAGMLAFYYYLLAQYGYTLEQAVDTDHQLSPLGILYTLAASLFGFSLFSRPLPGRITALLALLGRHSYFVYLVHPFVMFVLFSLISRKGLMMTSWLTITFYLATLGGSLLLAETVSRISVRIPYLGLLLTGSKAAAK